MFQISGRRRTAAEAHPRQNNVTEPIVAVIYCTLKHFPQSSPSGRSAPVRVRRHLTSKHNHCHRQKCRSSCHDNFKPPVLYHHHHQSVTQQHVQIISFSIKKKKKPDKQTKRKSKVFSEAGNCKLGSNVKHLFRIARLKQLLLWIRWSRLGGG